MRRLQVHTIMQSQTEALHTSMGLVREAGQAMSPRAVHVQDSGERDLSDQLLETWMLLEYCDQGNLETAAREARFQRDYVSAPSQCCPLRGASGLAPWDPGLTPHALPEALQHACLAG